jgi:DNA-binding NarL/FixJ family response regulator
LPTLAARPRRRASGPRTRILIVDRFALFRLGIASILGKEPEFDIVGAADDSRTAIDQALETSPDIVLIDFSLAPPDTIETIHRIKRDLPAAKIIVFSVAEDEDTLVHVIKAGAAAFILKDIGAEALLAIVRRVAAGEDLIREELSAEPAVASRVLTEFREQARSERATVPITSPLTRRETEILDAVATGMTNRQVALALSITEQTAKNHMSSILRKLSVKRRTQAVVYATHQGWIRRRD